MKLSQKLSDFNTEVVATIPYLITPAIATRLKITAGQVTDLTGYLATQNTLYSTYITPATHTADAVMALNDHYDLVHPYLEGIKQQLKNDKSITLLPLDFTSAHIHIDAPRRHHVPTPGFAPNNEVIQTTHLVNKIFTSNPITPHEKEKHLPEDITKIGRKLAILPKGTVLPTSTTDPKPAVGAEAFQQLNPIGTVAYDLVFAPEQQGAVAVLITWYMNNRGEKGPDSPPLFFYII